MAKQSSDYVVRNLAALSDALEGRRIVRLRSDGGTGPEWPGYASVIVLELDNDEVLSFSGGEDSGGSFVVAGYTGEGFNKGGI